MNIVLVLLVGLVINGYQSEKPINSFESAKDAIVESIKNPDSPVMTQEVYNQMVND